MSVLFTIEWLRFYLSVALLVSVSYTGPELLVGIAISSPQWCTFKVDLWGFWSTNEASFDCWADQPSLFNAFSSTRTDHKKPVIPSLVGVGWLPLNPLHFCWNTCTTKCCTFLFLTPSAYCIRLIMRWASLIVILSCNHFSSQRSVSMDGLGSHVCTDILPVLSCLEKLLDWVFAKQYAGLIKKQFNIYFC